MERMVASNDWHPETLKAELRKRGWTLQAIANEVKVSHTTVSNCLRGGASAKVRAVIGQILSTDPASIWPGRYRKALRA